MKVGAADLNKIHNIKQRYINVSLALVMSREKFESHEITLLNLGGGDKTLKNWIVKDFFSDVYGLILVLDSTKCYTVPEYKDVRELLLGHHHIRGKPVFM